MQLKLLVSATLVGAALADGKGRRRRFDANFDDLTAAPLDLEPVGIYKYLNWPGLSVGTEEVLGVQVFGVAPHTPPNVAYSDVISDTFAGPSLQADYPGSKTKHFDLKSFYYACIDVSQTPVATAENCTITVTGYTRGTQVATQDFTYDQDFTLTGDLNSPMYFGVFSSDFRGLTEVDITYSQTEDLDAPPAFIGDDFKYVVCLKSGKYYDS